MANAIIGGLIAANVPTGEMVTKETMKPSITPFNETINYSIYLNYSLQ